MHSRIVSGLSLALLVWSTTARAQERPSDLGFSIGRPEPVAKSPASSDTVVSVGAFRPVTLNRPEGIVRGQAPDAVPPIVTPPPPPPPPPPGAGLNLKSTEEAYNCGVVNNDSDLGSFWTRTGDRISRGWTEITGNIGDMFQGGQNRCAFQSDHAFDCFASPVTNPFYFEDPRALTEIKPIFIWQRTRSDVPFFAGGSNYFAGLQARVALTENFSLVLNRIGWMWIRPDAPSGEFQDGDGLSTINVGPKFTFYRSTETGTIAATGLNFEIPVGPSRVFQNTGNLSLSPYLSAGQEFLKSEAGAFHALGTAGYSLSIDSKRTDFLYTSLHLDYGIAAWRLYPLVELNWFHYTMNGSVRPLSFEGSNLFNFGSTGVAGHDDLTLAVGARFKLTENVQFGAAIEKSIIGGNRHMDDWRLTFDVIFRY
jgi:hypothetical protein